MATMILPTLIAACATAPSTTSESQFVGRLVDNAGTPLGDVEIQSVEGKHTTAPDGQFAVPLQPPNQLVHFKIGDAFFQRVQVPDDLGQTVELVLPAQQDRDVTCPPISCDVGLSWRIGSGLTAKATPKCRPNQSLKLKGLPTEPPQQVSCRVGRGRNATETPVEIVTQPDDSWLIAESGGDVIVTVSAPDGTLAPDCTVRVGRNDAPAAADGTFVARAAGPTNILATCAGRPATPTRVDLARGAQEEVSLDWSPTSPEADLGRAFPWATGALVRSRDLAWEMTVPLTDRKIVFPPLPAGQYTVYLSGEGATPVNDRPPSPIEAANVLSFSPANGQTAVGRLKLDKDRATGAIQVHQAPR